ncbi:hypothetical protein [Parvularcula maris]|uniref:Uncharacterized protein n=1 Tax=Parvularcula maris TaxID=2965077 RepID=A0A9X2RIX2_9PROT|nr:hypothetical protein [Parvularcula maris]MCQ8186555.1 hypothetical protein [Parvularcula maris]
MTEFAIGQEWSFASQDASGKAIVGDVGHDMGIDWVSVYVHNLSGFGANTQQDDFAGPITHMPFERKAFADSVDSLLAADKTVPESFFVGFRTWRDELVAGDAGWFDIDVARAVEMIVDTLNSRKSVQ